MPHLAQGELTAVEAGEIVDVNGRELAALATLKPGGNLQHRDFGEAVPIKVAMPEDASSRPVHCLLASAPPRANRSPRLSGKDEK